MVAFKNVSLAACSIFFLSCTSRPASPLIGEVSAPPQAARIEKKLEVHGDVRLDPYFWLNERTNPKVIDYLSAENRYEQEVMRDTEGLQARLFEEMKNHIKADDSTVPEKEDGYFYYRRYEKGREFPIYCRKKTLQAREQIVLDVNELAKGHAYYNAVGIQSSGNGKLLAFAEDTVGRRIYTIRIKNLETGAFLKDQMSGATGNFAWANDNKTLFYGKQDATTLRSQWIYRHQLGVASADTLVYDEKDDTFRVFVRKSPSDKFLFLISGSTLSDEVRYLDANTPFGSFKVISPRRRGHEYSVEDGGDRFYIRTNDHARNFRLMETPIATPGEPNWKEVVPSRDDTLLSDFVVFKTHLVLHERFNGLTRLNVIDRKTGKQTLPTFADAAYAVTLPQNSQYNTGFVRYEYESLNTPPSIIDYELKTGKTTVMKRQEVPGFKAELYESKRLFAPTTDGSLVPVSLVYRKDTRLTVATPLLVYAYGSYGYSNEPDFNSAMLSLLDRGFVFAIAHVRGGSEMGRYWYEEGRQGKKKNTFLDFIAVTEFLHETRISSPAHTYANGGSAGGLLIGAVANLRPDLYKGMVADVPFVDVVTTMLDTSIPLTTSEFDEWGNPAEREAYEYMKSYSPYDNVEAKAYPNILVTTGLHDSQVQYFEPAKWVAKLRYTKTDKNLLLLKTNMDAGHVGKSGRFERLKDGALRYAFYLKLEGRGSADGGAK